MVAPSRRQATATDASLKAVRLVMLGTLVLATIGGFLAFSSRQSSTKHAKGETLVLSTIHGNIRIALRPDLSPESVDYIREVVVTQNCDACNFYRAEKNFLLQGIIKNNKSKVKVTKGKCPSGYKPLSDDCPPDQFACGCHGPTMRKGLVGFAAGDTGPDFFITSAKDPVTGWGQTHTVFGEVKDDASFAVIDRIYMLPSTLKGLTMLDEKIDFQVSLE